MIDYRKINYGRHEPVVKLKKEECAVDQVLKSSAAQVHCLCFPTTFKFELQLTCDVLSNLRQFNPTSIPPHCKQGHTQ